MNATKTWYDDAAETFIESLRINSEILYGISGDRPLRLEFQTSQVIMAFVRSLSGDMLLELAMTVRSATDAAGKTQEALYGMNIDITRKDAPSLIHAAAAAALLLIIERKVPRTD